MDQIEATQDIIEWNNGIQAEFNSLENLQLLLSKRHNEEITLWEGEQENDFDFKKLFLLCNFKYFSRSEPHLDQVEGV